MLSPADKTSFINFAAPLSAVGLLDFVSFMEDCLDATLGGPKIKFDYYITNPKTANIGMGCSPSSGANSALFGGEVRAKGLRRTMRVPLGSPNVATLNARFPLIGLKLHSSTGSGGVYEFLVSSGSYGDVAYGAEIIKLINDIYVGQNSFVGTYVSGCSGIRRIPSAVSSSGGVAMPKNPSSNPSQTAPSAVIAFTPRNQILYGPPGTSKTYMAIRKAINIIDPSFGAVTKSSKEVQDKLKRLTASGQIVFTTFHQSYSYEDFIEGIRPDAHGGTVSYAVRDGIFKALCRAANPASITATADKNGEGESDAAESDEKAKDKPKNYVIIIDEINRGNISKIFGELITSIEESKRMGQPDAIEITLPYSGDRFVVPKNVYIIGTMNTADRSLTQLDVALRRRFRFELLTPKTGKDAKTGKDDDEVNIDLEKDGKKTNVNVKTWLAEVNRRIEILVDRDHMIGHAWFMELKASRSFEDFANLVRYKVMPLLQEYFLEDWESIRGVLGDVERGKNGPWIVEKKKVSGSWLPNNMRGKAFIYSINDGAFEDPKVYQLTPSKVKEVLEEAEEDSGGEP